MLIITLSFLKYSGERVYKKKRALITGITGQDGSYLAELLLGKNYTVFGLLRRSSTEPLLRIERLVLDKSIGLINGDLRDSAAVKRAVEIAKPDEIYNLAAQSDVGISFDCPEETFEINYYGVGRLVNAAIELNPAVKIYQASTSEMFGASSPPQNEDTPFQPVSPYAKAKTKAHQDYVVNYRERHGLFICSGILFNHESPRRGKHFVTRKITYSLAKIKLGLQNYLELGNLEARRDWGFAGDYVQAMWLMLQQPTPRDFVIATGKNHSVEEFVELAASFLDIKVKWSGEGVTRLGCDQSGKTIVKVSPSLFRPSEVSCLLGDASRARRKLGWQPKVSFEELVEMMAAADLKLVNSNSITLQQ